MSKQTFPVFVDQPGCTMRNFSIDGSAVGATAGTAGLDGRGQFLCTVLKSTNQVTINWNTSFAERPYVFIQPAPGQLDTLVAIITSTASQMVIQTFTASTNAALNDADLDFHVDGYNTTSYVS